MLQSLEEQLANFLLVHPAAPSRGGGSLHGSTIPWAGALAAVVVLAAEDGRRRRPPAGRP
jgi:hypothetical protein